MPENSSDDRDQLNPGEMAAVRRLVYYAAEHLREDILGAILKSGGFHDLEGKSQSDEEDKAVCRLADKLEATQEELNYVKPIE